MPDNNSIVHLPALADEAATQFLGNQLATTLHYPMIIALDGTLGVGKSTLARALLRTLGITGTIRSPSYSWVESYPLTSNRTIYHFDFYRFKDAEEWEAYGFNEYFNDSSVCLIEWSEKVLDYIPPIDLSIALDYADSGRRATASPYTQTGHACLSSLIPLITPR